MKNETKQDVDLLAWIEPLAKEIAESLTEVQIDELKRAFAYHHRNYVKPEEQA